MRLFLLLPLATLFLAACLDDVDPEDADIEIEGVTTDAPLAPGATLQPDAGLAPGATLQPEEPLAPADSLREPIAGPEQN